MRDRFVWDPKVQNLGVTWPWVKIQIVPPVNIPIQPLKQVLKWVVHRKPQNGTIGVEPQPHLGKPFGVLKGNLRGGTLLKGLCEGTLCRLVLGIW